MFDNAHGGVPSGGNGQNSEHQYGGITTTTNPLASYYQQHHQTANMLKRARPEGDGEDEHIPSSSRGKLDGSVPMTGYLGVCSSPSTKVPSPPFHFRFFLSHLTSYGLKQKR